MIINASMQKYKTKIGFEKLLNVMFPKPEPLMIGVLEHLHGNQEIQTLLLDLGLVTTEGRVEGLQGRQAP